MATPYRLLKKRGALKSTPKNLSFLRGNFQGLSQTPLMGSWDLIEKDHTESSTTRDEDRTIWKPWMDENWSTRGIWGT